MMSLETHDARDFVVKYSCKNHSSCDYAHCCDYADLTDGNFQDKVKKRVHSGCNGCLSPWRRWEVPPLEVPSQRQDCHESHGPAALDSFDSFDSFDRMPLLLILHIFHVQSFFTRVQSWLAATRILVVFGFLHPHHLRQAWSNVLHSDVPWWMSPPPI